ncbi:hypothetical protein [Bradyrhizobium sp. McL0616]|uniref:hypothetical protein n=1 Tax=Bradyrhizobium sp. McL0616 TaxID=3415674 RepID=UPI003CEA8A9C
MAIQSGGIDADLMVIQKAVGGLQFAIQCRDKALAHSIIEALIKRPNSDMANEVGRAMEKWVQHF